MTTKTVTLTSYNVPQWLKDKINAMATIEEVVEYQSSVVSPGEQSRGIAGGQWDTNIWWACAAVLDAQRKADREAARTPLTNEQMTTIDRSLTAIDQMKADGDWALGDD